MDRMHVQAFAAVVVLVLAAVLAATGQPVTTGWLRAFGFCVAAASLAVLAFDKFLWRFPLLQGWFVKRPNLKGVWTVQFASEWVDPNTGNKVPPRPATLTIKQTFTALQVQMRSEESKGSLVCACIVPDGHGGYRLCGTYLNEPDAAVRAASRLHYGTFLVDVVGSASRPSGLDGTYWTDRQTFGRLTAARA